MANPTFKYPDTTTPVATIEFERAEFQGDVTYKEANQISDTSMYGEILTHSRGTNLKIIPLTVQVPIADQDDNIADVTKLDTFINSTVNFTVTPFYFTDSNSVSTKVKIINKDALEPTEDFPSYRQFKIIMKEVE